MATGKITKPKITVKTLWANPNPNVDFGQQTVQFSETVSLHEEVIIVFKEYITYNYYYETAIRVGDTDIELVGIPGSSGSSSGTPTIVKRRVGVGANPNGFATGATFYEAYGAPTNGSFSVNNNNCIPIEIRKVYIE